MSEQTINILLVEDEEAHAELARRSFESHGGRFHLTIAGSLAEARACLAKTRPHLILADLSLPDGRGIDLLPLELQDPEVPLVVMTAQGDERAAVESMKAGALDYVVKSGAVLADAAHVADRALREFKHITERRRVEEALRHTEGQCHKVFDNSNDAIFVIDPEQDSIVDANSRACSMLSYSREELLAVPISAVHPGNNMAELMAFAQSVFESGKGWTDELTCYTKDGRVLDTEISASSINIGGRRHIMAMVRDITERIRVKEALRHSEARNAALLESASEGILVTDGEARIVIVNARTEALFGYNRDELVGQAIEMLVPDSLRGFHVAHRSRFFSDPQRRLMGAGLGCLGQHKDGSQFPVDISLNSVLTEEGTLVIVFIVDLTERNRAEEALRRSEATNRAFVRAIPDVMYRVSRDGLLLDSNFAERKDLLYAPEWPIGKALSEALSPEAAWPAMQCIDRALQTGQIQVLETQLLNRGEMRDREVRFVANGPDEVLAIARDTTERKQAEEEVRKLSSAVEQVSVAVVLTDIQGCFEYVNPAFTRITGYGMEDVKGKNPSILKSGRTSQKEYHRLWKTILSGREWRGEFHNMRKDGQSFWVSASISSIRNAKGIITHFIAVEEDITERKRAEEELSRLAEETAIIAEIGRIISSSLEIDEVYERFSQEVSKLIPFDRIAINLIDLENQVTTKTYVMGTDVPGRRRGRSGPLTGSFTGLAVRTMSGQLAQFESEAVVVQRFPGLAPQYKAGLVCFIAIPLVSRGEVVGVMNIQSAKPGAYTESDVAMAERVGAQIAGAIANARLYAQRLVAEEALSRLAEENALIAEIGRIISSSVDIDEVYERFCQEVGKLIAFDRIAINLVDLENRTYSKTYVSGTETPELRRGQTSPMAGSFVELAVRTMSAQLAHFQSEEELAWRFPRLLNSYRAGLVSFLAVPLVSKGEVVGVIFFQSAKPDAYGEGDVALAERVGAQIAGAVANARLYAQRVVAEDRLRASLDEKEVLVKEINHRVKNNLQIISSLLSLQSRDIQDQQALQAFKVSQDRIKAMALVHEKFYQSENLGQIDFGGYLQSLTADLYNSYGLNTQGIELQVDVDRILMGVDTAIPCGLIINELVSNALKHAFLEGVAGEISVSVREEGDEYTLVVKDNGVGLPEGLDIRQTTTLGLTIVNALAQQIRGAIDLSSDGGSEIKITFPAK
tara:strand:- start:310 stop:3903 length:3594 start_codon:yes stop_codon:yes gene_type:complete